MSVKVCLHCHHSDKVKSDVKSKIAILLSSSHVYYILLQVLMSFVTICCNTYANGKIIRHVRVSQIYGHLTVI